MSLTSWAKLWVVACTLFILIFTQTKSSNHTLHDLFPYLLSFCDSSSHLVRHKMCFMSKKSPNSDLKIFRWHGFSRPPTDFLHECRPLSEINVITNGQWTWYASWWQKLTMVRMPYIVRLVERSVPPANSHFNFLTCEGPCTWPFTRPDGINLRKFCRRCLRLVVVGFFYSKKSAKTHRFSHWMIVWQCRARVDGN
jgi:hypothetical protein